MPETASMPETWLTSFRAHMGCYAERGHVGIEDAAQVVQLPLFFQRTKQIEIFLTSRPAFKEFVRLGPAGKQFASGVGDFLEHRFKHRAVGEGVRPTVLGDERGLGDKALVLVDVFPAKL